MLGLLSALLDESESCPACGEPMVQPTQPVGYEQDHCLSCAMGVELRRTGFLEVERDV